MNVDPSVQPSSTTSSQSPVVEDANVTGSLEFTQDYTTPVHDNTSRKSLGRRVSFASHSHVRMFETIHSSSTGSPHSSPASALPDGTSRQPDVTNENDYPRQSLSRRRSLARYSIADSDMDLTSIIPGSFLPGGSVILNEDFGDDDDDNDDMDVTEAIRGDFARKRSLSLGIRQPLSQISSAPTPASDDADRSQSDIGNDSIQSDATSNQSQAMEFTVPLGQSLRPADQDQVWLALKQATHSGNNASEAELSSEDEMNLDDAMWRLRRARDSISLAQVNMGHSGEHQDNSFTSTDDSFEDDGNKTVNLSQAFGSASTAQGDSRLSMDSNMDESEVYGDILPSEPAPRQSMAPRQSIAPTTSVVQPSPLHQPPTFSVFRPPSSNEYKTKPKPTFSAAFAPPVSRPSPKKPATSALSSPIKRPRSTIDDDVEDRDMVKASPPKRQASTASKRSSGYYAKRKSLAAGLQPPLSSIITATVASVSPKKKPGIGLGRASLGSGPSNAWARFNKDIGQAVELPTVETETEASRQASASPSVTIISPAPIGTPPNGYNSTPIPQVPSVESDELVIERAQSAEPQDIEEPSGTMGVDIEATEQWREGVQQDDQYEEDAVWIKLLFLLDWILSIN